MMGNRTLPFGYEMRNGVPCEQPDEARTVRWIFERYLAEASYNALVAALSDGGIPYDRDRAWNKNMVARILADSRYTGLEPYPALITTAQFRGAAARKPDAGAPRKADGFQKLLRTRGRCTVCGSKLTLGANQFTWERWNCPQCRSFPPSATTSKLISLVLEQMRRLTENPYLVGGVHLISAPDSTHICHLENDLLRELDKPNCDEIAARGLALALAAARYEQLGNEDYETERLRRIFEAAEPSAAQDAELLQNAASAILVYPNGEVALKLKNGQITERT